MFGIDCKLNFVSPFIVKKMKTNFSLLFYLKKPKNYVSGPVPTYLRITVNGERAETTSNRECDPNLWNSYSGRIEETTESIKSLNAYLDGLQHQVYDAHKELIALEQLLPFILTNVIRRTI